MKQIDFKDIKFEHMIICGIEGMFTSLRVDKSTIPDGWNKYSIRHSDDGEEWFYTLERFVWANHFGDFITNKEVEIDNECNCIYINEDYSYIENNIYTQIMYYFMIYSGYISTTNKGTGNAGIKSINYKFKTY